MNWVDIGFLVFVLGGGTFGYITGFLNQIGRVIGLIAAVYGAVHFHLPVTSWLQPAVEQPFAGILSYVMVFVLIYISCLFLVTALDKVLRATNLKSEDRKLGALFGVVKGVLISALLLFGFALYPGKTIAKDIEASYTGQPLLIVTQAVVMQVPDAVQNRVEQTFEEIERYRQMTDDGEEQNQSNGIQSSAIQQENTNKKENSP